MRLLTVLAALLLVCGLATVFLNYWYRRKLADWVSVLGYAAIIIGIIGLWVAWWTSEPPLVILPLDERRVRPGFGSDFHPEPEPLRVRSSSEPIPSAGSFSVDTQQPQPPPHHSSQTDSPRAQQAASENKTTAVGQPADRVAQGARTALQHVRDISSSVGNEAASAVRQQAQRARQQAQRARQQAQRARQQAQRAQSMRPSIQLPFSRQQNPA